MHGLDLVTQVVDEAHHGLEIPPFAAHAFPYLTVVLKGSEGDECVVRRAAAEDFGAGVSDVRVTCSRVRGGEIKNEERTCHWAVQWFHSRNQGHHQAVQAIL